MVLDVARFPEVTTLGSMFGFALALEEAGEALVKSQANETAAKIAETHRKRRRLLEEARREKLNEVTLEPISGFVAGQYLITADEPSLAVLREFEANLTSFYRDAALLAKNIAPEIAKLFERFAKESQGFVERIA